MLRYTFITLALALPGVTSAQSLVDGGFEDPNLSTGNYSYTIQPVGWTGTGALVNAQGASAWYGTVPPAGQEGAQFYALQESSSIFQNFTATRTGRLDVSWLAAGRPNLGPDAGDQSYTVSVTGSGIENGSLGTFTTTSGEAFTRRTGFATVTAGQIYSLSFLGLTATDETAFLDDVRIASVVPETASWTMMIAGFALVGAVRRRRGVGARRFV